MQAPTFVQGPDYSLTIENHSEHTYPVDGWYWFDTLDKALAGMAAPPAVPTVSALQGMLAIYQAGLAVTFNAWKSSLDPVSDFAIIAFFERAQTWQRDNPYLNQGAAALGLSDEQIDDLFQVAATL